MSLNHDYPEIQCQTYGLMIDNPGNRAFISPTYFFLGDARRAALPTLKEWSRIWGEFEAQELDFEKRFRFDSPLKIGEDDEGKDIRANLHDLTHVQRINAAAERIKLRYGVKSFITRGGTDVFEYNADGEKQGPKLETHTGQVVLSGFVRKKGDARKGPLRSSFHQVSVAGPFKNSRHPFGKLDNDSRYFKEIYKKGGYQHIQIVDTEIAALLLFAAGNPAHVGDFDGKREFFVPFRTDSIDERTWKYFTYENLPHISRTVTDLTPLKMDVFFERVFRQTPYFTLDKILTTLPVFDLKTIEMIEQGQAKWVALARKYPLKKKDYSHLDRKVAEVYAMIDRQMEEDGFVETDTVLEKKDSLFETPCLHYVGPDNQVRRVTLDGRPPLIIERRKNPDAPVFPVRNIEGSWQHDFFSELYKQYRKGRLDDMTRAVGEYMVTIPEPRRRGEYIDDSVMQDYARLLINAINDYNKAKPEDYRPESINRAANRARAAGRTRAASMIFAMPRILSKRPQKAKAL
jgi:hypothetical protein